MGIKKTSKQGFGFAIVGFFGTLLNGLVYSILNQFSLFRGIPLDWGVFSSINWAWGVGILVGFIFNFLCDKFIVFEPFWEQTLAQPPQ